MILCCDRLNANKCIVDHSGVVADDGWTMRHAVYAGSGFFHVVDDGDLIERGAIWCFSMFIWDVECLLNVLVFIGWWG